MLYIRFSLISVYVCILYTDGCGDVLYFRLCGQSDCSYSTDLFLALSGQWEILFPNIGTAVYKQPRPACRVIST